MVNNKRQELDGFRIGGVVVVGSHITVMILNLWKAFKSSGIRQEGI